MKKRIIHINLLYKKQSDLITSCTFKTKRQGNLLKKNHSNDLQEQNPPIAKVDHSNDRE